MTVPNSLAGQMDDAVSNVDGFGSAVDYLLEHVPEMRHPWSIPTLAQMSHEPQLSSILRVFNLAISRGTWTVDGAGCDPTVTAQIADDLGLPVKGEKPTQSGARRRRFSWAKHLPTASRLSLKYGHGPFAQSWVQERVGQRRTWRLDMVQERMPQTIDAFELNSDGTLKWVEQGTGTDLVKITTADHRLVWYDREREGSNYYGTSLLRPSYGPWLIKQQMLRVLATSHRRFGMGVPGFEPQPGANPTPQMETAAQQVLSRLQASSQSHVVPPPGYRYTLTGMTGSVPDTLGFITYLDRLMTRSTLTSILDMATAERGNRSLGETVMALMVFAQQDEGQRIAEDATTQIVVPLVDANFGETEPSPQISVTGIGRDRQLTSQDIAALLQYGGLNPDDTLEEAIRAEGELPPIDHATRRLEITEQPPVDPDAPTDPTTEVDDA
ncbi:hypothetical protein [uncultured Jatrophihabitans sp.]|uniref:phage portal protein family protein n=1 Tax=uncultured Jatrophihabitans sp. TaxID=1610747 RepID=UPI0035C94789